MDSISKILDLTFSNKYYREYLKLLFRFGRSPRYQKRNIKFLDYTVTVIDCLSFIYQFKEIFVKQYYLFESSSTKPLIYDCGANIGISCLFFKKYFPEAKIKAFEADKKIADVLKNNLQKNNIYDVDIYVKAVWKDNNGISFYADTADAGSIYGQGEQLRVDTVRLKDIIEQESGSIDFLKIDIEGAEMEVVPDLGESIRRIKNIFIEYHSLINREQELNKILEILSRNGFRYFINSVYEKPLPFRNKIIEQSPNMDLQLNIFAYK